MEIRIFFATTKKIRLDFLLIRKIIHLICIREKKIPGNINIIFCNNPHIYNINKKYLKHYYPTDVITFNYNNGNIIEGDIFIGLDVVYNNANYYKVKFKYEIYRVIIHSILHLVGYDDKNEKLKSIMREKEDYYLKYVNY